MDKNQPTCERRNLFSCESDRTTTSSSGEEVRLGFPSLLSITASSTGRSGGVGVADPLPDFFSFFSFFSFFAFFTLGGMGTAGVLGPLIFSPPALTQYCVV